MDHAPVHENHQSYCCEPDVSPSCTPCQEILQYPRFPFLSVIRHVGDSHVCPVLLICASTEAGVILFADVWTCTDASEIPPTQLDKWIKPILDKGLQDGPNSIEMTESLKSVL